MINKRKIGITLSYIYFIVSTLVGIFISSFVVRTIGKTDYGVYQSMTAFVSYLMLLEFGSGTIMSRNLSLLKKDGTDDEEIKKNLSTIWTLTSILAIAICFVAFVFFLLIPSIYSKSMSLEQIIMGKRLFVFAVFSLICSFIQQMMNGIFIGNEFYLIGKILSIIKLILRSVLIVSLLKVRTSIYCIVLIDALMNILVLSISYVFIKANLKYKFTYAYFDKKIFNLIVPLCLAMFLQTIVNTVNGSVGKFLISIMMTPEDVSVYSIAMTMFTMFSCIATLPVTMFMPQIAKGIKNGLKGKALAEILVMPCRLNVLITGLIAFGFVLIGKQFIVILFGLDFENAWLCATVVILPMFLNMSNSVIVNVLDVLNKRHIRSLIMMITTVGNIGMTLILVKIIGITGAAFATGISIICQVIILNYFYATKIGLPVMYLFRQSFKGIVTPMICSCVGVYLLLMMFENLYIQFWVGGVIFVAFFTILYFLFGMNNYEHDIVKKIINKIFYVIIFPIYIIINNIKTK